MGISVAHMGLTLAAGFLCGFVVSVPVGPVNLTVINQALRKGFRGAFLVGLGAISAEMIYVTLALIGHSSVLDEPSMVVAVRIAAVVIISLVGLRALLIKPEKFAASEARAERVEERWHHPRSFLLGFALTISNLMLVVLWATLTTVLFARQWVEPAWPSRFMCALGVFCGGVSWFLLLASFVSRAHRRIKPSTLAFLVRCCGVILLGFAALLAFKVFRI